MAQWLRWGTYVLVDAFELAVELLARDGAAEAAGHAVSVAIHGVLCGVLEQQSWAAVAEALAVAVFQIFSVHPSAVLPHGLQFRSVEHLAQFLELVFPLHSLFVVGCLWIFISLH